MSSLTSWRELSVDDLCLRVTSGGTPKRTVPEYYSPATIPWVKTGDLLDTYVSSYSEYISDRGLQESSAKILPADTVLMAMYGATVGALGILSEEATCNQASCALITDPEVCNPRWLFYALLNGRNYIVSQATGAAQQNLSGKTIRQFRFLTPPISEQRAIAEVLGALDDKIAANNKIAAISDEFIRTEYQKLLHESFETRIIGDFVEQRRESVNPENVSPTLPYIGLEHIPQRLLWSAEHGMSNEVSSNKSKFISGDILFGKLRPYFHKVIAATETGICSTDVLVMTPLYDTLTGYILAAVSHDSVIREATASSSGTRMPRTNWKDLSAISIPWPGETKALDFSKTVSALQEHVISSLNENHTLASIRDTLLPQLMSGKIRVREAEAVVEDVL